MISVVSASKDLGKLSYPDHHHRNIGSPSSPPPAYSDLTDSCGDNNQVVSSPGSDRSYLSTIGSYSSFKVPSNRHKCDASPHQIYASLRRNRQYSGDGYDRSSASHTPGAMFSCADVDSVLDNSCTSGRSPSRKTPNKQNTSVSSHGSSRVDAEELCNQIDNLFFRDVYV